MAPIGSSARKHKYDADMQREALMLQACSCLRRCVLRLSCDIAFLQLHAQFSKCSVTDCCTFLAVLSNDCFANTKQN